MNGAADQTGVAYDVNNNSGATSVWPSYFLGVDGTSAARTFVAWVDDTSAPNVPNCYDYEGNSSNKVFDLYVKIKFFTCETAAQAFYDEYVADTGNTDVIMGYSDNSNNFLTGGTPANVPNAGGTLENILKGQ
eukprot:CAMPEP_0170521342 /NCGR_PEP_ID=MMETSP0209-20121228/6672_1 /TAXON_ID=665100 ORGANISM="Litonotus pictus, Strain P1" /NCGR_SAMPLE_ID=MMETSP0209 /ASSEMBLY_ACC=CAM_ASM_000301 /LENGTH=132 /DNA_ID=CAMNT_0010808129 /DNA_START=281 /DNA_END=676 /DNA_ORIENTATION=-